jgi:hypothetical protein
MNTKNNDYFGISLNANPLESYDFYEPRAQNRYVNPRRMGGSVTLSSNYNNNLL